MESSRVRKPAVAGQFYPSVAGVLKVQIEAFLDKKADKSDALACMLPHAGYAYSGRVAVATLSQINIKKRIVLLGPNHTGLGAEFSIMTDGEWQTPLGNVGIDAQLAGKILSTSRYLKDDATAQLQEHSLEVELPLLQYFKSDFSMVPIVVCPADMSALKEIGSSIASAIKELGVRDEVLLVGSSDMTHYAPQKEAERKDKEAIGAILKLDPDELMQRIRKYDISMCGYAPVTVMLSAAKELGAVSARLIKYETSGEASRDFESVVGYAGIIIS